MLTKSIFDVLNEEIIKRWENYIKANADFSHARDNEMRKVFSLANPKEGQLIWELGTGNGISTFLLAKALGNTGKLITTDVNPGNIEFVENKNKQEKLSIECILLPLEQNFLKDKKYENYFDTIVTLATFHHFDNRLENTGDSGRREAFNVCYNNLKDGGIIIIADPLDNTISQRYFTAIDNPEHLPPIGHPHDFPTKDGLHKMAEDAGFKDIKIEILNMPWQFNSENEAKNFIHTLHNAKCSPEESLETAKKHLDFKKVNNHYELGWELFFLSATK